MLPLPYAIERKTNRTPWATWGLIAVNLLVYLCLMGVVPTDRREDVFRQIGFVPGDAHWYALLTSAFVHAGFRHLIWNMLFLWLFGSLVEDALGAGLFLLLYLGGHLGASAAHAAIANLFHTAAEPQAMVGASGAIAAVLGLSAMRFYRTKVRVFYWVVIRVGVVGIPAWVFVALFMGYNLIMGVVDLAHQVAGLPAEWAQGGIANWAHVGGFAFGMAGGALLRLPSEGKKDYLLEDVAARGVTAEARLSDLRALAAARPQEPRARHALAKYLLAMPRAEEAEREYMAAIGLYLRAGQRQEAVKAYEELVRTFPGCALPPEDQLALGAALEETDQPREALHALEKLLEAHPKSPQAELALLRTGQIHADRLRNPGLAYEALKRLLREYPDSPWAAVARQKAEEIARRASGR